MVPQHCQLTGRAQKARLLASVVLVRGRGLIRLGYLGEKIKLLVDPLGTVDTVRRDKSSPGSKK